jgi:predicted DCC family thiol-disulfide oxidoreductase YuxK
LQRNWLLSAVAAVMVVPPFSWLSALSYRLVAKYRHKLPGGTPACKLPTS